MRTSAVVAFICLAMGVAPSFSLPSISLRAHPSKRSEHGQGSPPRRYFRFSGIPNYWYIYHENGGYLTAFDSVNGWTPPSGNVVPLNWRPPDIHRNDARGTSPTPNPTPTPEAQQRRENHDLNFQGSSQSRILPASVFAEALKQGHNVTFEDARRG
ncbi:hypothetical protein F5148DRAFT_1241619 [Russula earlei]|uniref:Uncharacterized protein n=1 Tax=Russula earlei TaxID=71964 RepID=A0ACC0TVL8_9AGAM|nr:hypothetical protein F5148DRAFT_1241619 [Russula earlei]